MIDCFSTIFCTASSEDKTTSIYSLFGIIETIKSQHLGIPLPVETVSYWSAAESREIQFRQVVKDADGNLIVHSPPFPATFVCGINKVRVQGIVIPSVAGKYSIAFEWRDLESVDWKPTSGQWFFNLEQLPGGAPK